MATIQAQVWGWEGAEPGPRPGRQGWGAHREHSALAGYSGYLIFGKTLNIYKASVPQVCFSPWGKEYIFPSCGQSMSIAWHPVALLG